MVKRVLLFGGVVTLFCGLFSCAAYADDPVTASSTFSIDASNVVLQITAPATATINLQPISSAAVFNSTNVTVNVATNNATGYTFTMDVSSTDLAHSTITGQDAPVIPTLSAAATQANFPANAWGYKAIGDNYVPVVSSNSSPVWKSEGPTNGTDHIITLGASVNGTKPSGTYTNTLVFNAVANSLVPHDNVTFNGNGADSGDMTSDAISVTSGDSTLLPANKFTKSGYRFLGWNTSTSGTGLSYADEGEYNAVSTNYNQNITLYAMWSNLPDGASTSGTTPGGNPGITISRAYEIAYTAAHKGMWEKDAEGNGYTQISDGVYHNRDVRWDMQGMTPEICESVTAIGDIYGALDTRDWHIYNITKAKDGRCWLQDNLALDPTDSTVASRLKGRTNAPDDAIDHYTGASSTAVPGYTTTAVWNAVGVDANSYDTPIIDNSVKDTIPSDSLSTAGGWKVGIYYNFCAVTAGSYCYDYSWQLDRPNTAIDAEYDICPTGWRLPTGYYNQSSGGEVDGAEWQKFVEEYYDQNTLQRNALRLVYSGEHNYWGNISGLGNAGVWWSSTYYFRSNEPYHEFSAARISTDNLNLQDYTSNRRGMISARCIAK